MIIRPYHRIKELEERVQQLNEDKSRMQLSMLREYVCNEPEQRLRKLERNYEKLKEQVNEEIKKGYLNR